MRLLNCTCGGRKRSLQTLVHCEFTLNFCQRLPSKLRRLLLSRSSSLYVWASYIQTLLNRLYTTIAVDHFDSRFRLRPEYPAPTINKQGNDFALHSAARSQAAFKIGKARSRRTGLSLRHTRQAAQPQRWFTPTQLKKRADLV